MTKKTGRKRGAPFGNTNRLMHGIYARHISIQVGDDILEMPQDQNQDELALARARLVACLDKQQQASSEDWLVYEKAIAHYLANISKLTHTNAVLGKDRRT